MTDSIVPIVEGFAEVASVPVLMRRLLGEWGKHQLEIGKPVRVRRYQVIRQGELERRVTMAMQRPNCRAVVVILDADDDCPKDFAPGLLRRAQQAAQNTLVSVVLAKSEMESWFVGSIESLRGVRGISGAACSPSDPEGKRDAKGYLTEAMQKPRTYVGVDDQPAFAEKFDLTQARGRCRSLKKFYDDFYRIACLLTS